MPFLPQNQQRQSTEGNNTEGNSLRAPKISIFWKYKKAAAAILKIEKSPDLGRDLTDFYEIWHGDAVRLHWPFRPLKFQKFKYPRWRLPPSLKIEKSQYLSNGLTDRRKIWHGDAYWQVDSYLPYRQLKIWPFKNRAWCTGDVWTIEKLDVGKGLTDRDNLTVKQPRLTQSAVKITNPNRQPTLTILLQNQNLFGG